jgi:hypothetical protein
MAFDRNLLLSQFKRSRQHEQWNGDTLGKLIFVISNFYRCLSAPATEHGGAFMSSHDVRSLPHLHYLTINYSMRRQ